MSMFRFWGSDARGSDKSVDSPELSFDSSDLEYSSAHPQPEQPTKKRRLTADDTDEFLESAVPAKRARAAIQDLNDACDVTADPMDLARDKIMHQFGLEILLKHDELRLINQELAKCQVALEQLRRCSLIPYPTACATPEQMMDVSSGKGPAFASRPGEAVPKWAPPFGVTDGPYARHYAKWLIPDPAFDGMQPEWQFTPEATRARASFAEGRTTRNSFTEPAMPQKGRSGRGSVVQKLQALSNGYPQPKEKAGPCVLKRSDGTTVKLVCLDCNRENFSSTQGFINHCRIAHKRDFKSHEEAAVQSGQPYEVSDSGATLGEEKSPVSTLASGLVHPLARQDVSDQQVYAALRSRISDSLKLYHQGKLPGVSLIPSAPAAKDKKAKFDGAPDAPYLSRLLQSRKFNGNLQEIITDAKTKTSINDFTLEDESDVELSSDSGKIASQARSPVVKRVPVGTMNTPAPQGVANRPASSKGHQQSAIPYASPPNSALGSDVKPRPIMVVSDEDMDMEDANLSPNTLVSNNAPSLVSDDGEYDDSDEGSSVSGSGDNMDTESVSDVAEISLDDEHEPRPLRRGSSTAVKLRKTDPKHVTFMTPVKNKTKERRPRQV